MRVNAYLCDMCECLISEEQKRIFKASLDGLQISKDLCPECSIKLKHYFNNMNVAYTNTKSVSKIQSKQQESTPVDEGSLKANEVYVKPLGVKSKGPLTLQQKKSVIKMYNEGKSIDDIATYYDRNPKTILKYINELTVQHESTSDVPTKVLDKPLDKGKIRALANAGWNTLKIAQEMDVDVDIIKNALLEIRK